MNLKKPQNRQHSEMKVPGAAASAIDSDMGVGSILRNVNSTTSNLDGFSERVGWANEVVDV